MLRKKNNEPQGKPKWKKIRYLVVQLEMLKIW